jgi:hypothetical protein
MKMIEMMIDEFCCNEEVWKCEIIDDYSGRFMYGSTTYAITVKSWNYLLKALMFNDDKLTEFMTNDENDLYPNVAYKQDNLGNNIVIY